MTNEMSSSTSATMLEGGATAARSPGGVHQPQQQQTKKKNARSFLMMIYLYIRAVLRILFILLNNLYCLPTYLVWMTMLWPLKIFNSRLYYKIEGLFYHWLLNMVTVWGHTAGYGILEYGDQAEMYFEKRALVIANHQSTGDVPILMTAFNQKPMVVPNIMWVMDKVFKYTNFGVVCSYHQDFFIESGPERREEAVVLLKEHLATKYVKRNRRWLVLFPEGGFLRKRLVKGQQYAQKNNLPILTHTTLPRVGALNGIRDVLIDPSAAQDSSNTINLMNTKEIDGKGAYTKTDHGVSMGLDSKLEYVIDITIAYPDGGHALDIPNVLTGIRPPCDTHLYYRAYPINEVPTNDVGIKNWFYERFIEREQMLETFYKTNLWPTDPNCYKYSVSSSSGAARTPQSGRRVKHDALKSIMLHFAFLLSTYLHVQMFVGLAYLWHKAMQMM